MGAWRQWREEATAFTVVKSHSTQSEGKRVVLCSQF